MRMKVSDLLKMDVDIDVVDDLCEELYIAFCGPMELTECGVKEFGEVLNYEVTIDDDIAVIHIDCDDELRMAKELFDSLAGYCSCEDYDAWFREVEL